MKLLKNLGYLFGAEGASKLVTFAAIAHLARVVGPQGFGYVEFAGSALLCAGLLVDQGFSPFGAREIAKAPASTGTWVSQIVIARFILALVAYVATVLFALTFNHSPIVTRLLLVYGFSLLGMPLLLQWVFQGQDQMHIVAAIQLIRQTIYAAVIFAFVRSADQIVWVAVAEVAGVVGAAIFGVGIFQSRFGSIVLRHVRISPRLFREGIPIGLSQLFWMIRMFGATVFLGLMAAASDVGYFGAAMRILVALHAFIYLYYFNLLPSLARAWQNAGGDMEKTIARSLHGLAWASLLVGSIWVLLAPLVITTVYGGSFAPAGVTLQWLAGVGVAALLNGHYRFALIAAGRQTSEMMSQMIGSVLALVLLPVGYVLMGPGGAAVALVIAELAVWLTAWWWAERQLRLKDHAPHLGRPLIALSLVLALAVASPPSLITQLVALVGVVAALALLLDRVIRNSTMHLALLASRWLRAQWTKRAPEASH